MKKLLLSLVTVFLISANAMAFNIYIDAFGTYVGNGTGENLFGGGGDLLFGINKNFNVGVKFSQTFFIPVTKEQLTSNYNQTIINAGVEYNFQILNLPLFWSSYAGVGIEKMDISKPNYTGVENIIILSPSGQIELHDMGFAFQIMTGARWDFHSHMALFANIGFHMPFYANQLKAWNINGLIAQVGVRFAIWNNKPIDDQY